MKDKSVIEIARSIADLNIRAVKEYTPIVDSILRTCCPDKNHIEHTLDGLLDFCGDDSALDLFKKLCRYYYEIDPSLAYQHVLAYREMWDLEK